MTWSEDPMSARTDYTGCKLVGSTDGQILYSPPEDEHGWYYATGVADPSPETSAFIHWLDAELAALHPIRAKHQS